MAGAVAMASVIEDFETQPRKRQRKDVPLPPVKTITNYYSPVPKPFSPPKSNILDYFCKSPGAKGAASEQTKENRNGERESPGPAESPVRPHKPQRLRRGRKPGRPSKLAPSAEDGCVETPPLVVESSESSCSSDVVSVATEKQRPTVLGSETAALLAQICADDCIADESQSEAEPATIRTPPKKSGRENLKKGSSGEHRREEGPRPSVELSDPPTPVVKRKRGRPAGKTKSVPKCSPEAREADGSPRDASPEGKADEPSELNNSTVFISFEDFVESQSREDGSAFPETPESKAEVSAAPRSAEGQPGPSQQVSPRTLTVQAEVHPISPATELDGTVDQKLASIFTPRRRRPGSEGGEGKATVSPPPPQEKPATSPPGPVRRSNVVLREDELELSVIESGSAPRPCSQTERKQFMNAFKQAGADGGKGKAKKKDPGKQGEAGPEAQQEEEAERQGEEEAERQGEEVRDEQGPAATPALETEKQQAGTEKERGGKLRKRGRKRAREEAAAAPAAAPEEPAPLEAGSGVHGGGANDTPSSTPASRQPTRRSARPRPCGVTPNQREEPTPPTKTRSRERSKGRGGTGDSPTEPATPRRHKPKHGMFRAEMISPPDEMGSPIRMRLRRIFSNIGHYEASDANDLQILSPLAAQKPNVSKKREQAKKLVQKARVLKQNKKAEANADSKEPVRRLSRNRLVQKSYCEDEDSIVCLSDGQSSPAAPAGKDEVKGQKPLRSLNDVLGRTAPVGSKAVKGAAGPKVAAMFLGKKPPKNSAVISIFDDSSQDGSENSQDSEQFKARRDFLKSGLPESFKRQTERTAASRDAYALACASFQPTVHVLQRPPECPFWSLPWPGSSLLKRLSEAALEPPAPLLPPGAFDCTRTKPALRARVDKGSGWRQDFAEDSRKRLLEEIRASNPLFPVRRFLTWFLKKREEHLLQSASAEADTGPEAPGPQELPELGGKRKRRRDGEGVHKVPKRRRSARGEQETIVIADEPPAGTPPDPAAKEPVGRGRLSRTRGGRQAQNREADSEEQTPAQEGPAILLEETPPPGHTEKECGKEDVLWTEKYQPQHSNEVIGNSAAVKRLRTWLEEWKQRADREEKRNWKEKKQEVNSNDSWDCGDFRGEGDAEDGGELLCNTLLITGPPGVGKTAAVYACAQELGFKVFEVNASSQRSGRQILSQLKEATQSHQVDIQGANAHKPSYFSGQSSQSAARPGFCPRKVNSPRKVLSSPRKVVSSPRKLHNSPCRQPKRGTLAPTSLASIFKVGSKAKGRDPSVGNDPLQNDSDPPRKSAKTKEARVPKTEQPPLKPPSDKKEPPTEEQNKKAATSLILFEEVDVIFDDDSGFLAAIKTFMTTTKRPVILTTSDPTFGEMFDGDFEEIHFKTPSEANVTSYLQLLCLAEGVRTDARDVSALLRWNRCDVRRCLLHLHFWVRSGGGPGPNRPLPAPETPDLVQGETPGGAVKPKEEEQAASSTSCDTRCTESLLGILNIDGPQDLSDALKCSSSAEPASGSRSLELLVEGWGRGVDLLYSNMEALLPLPTCALRLPSCALQRPLHAQQGVLNAEPRSASPSEDASPLKTSSRLRNRKRSALAGGDPFQSDSDSDDGFLSLPKLQGSPAYGAEEPSADGDEPRSDPAGEGPPPPPGPASSWPKKADRTPEERRGAELVSSCLGSLAEFMDHMSFLDASLHRPRRQPEGACRPGAFGWTGAEIKNGLSDEPRMEEDVTGRGGRENAARIRAAVESMSFRKCRAGVSEAWAGAQGLPGETAVGQLTLPVAPHRTGLSFCQTSPCEPTVSQRRCDVMETLLTSRAFGTIGNRPATATDYLPFLRSVCRSERLKEQGKVKRRFLHYLDNIHLGLPKSTVQLLAADFP